MAPSWKERLAEQRPADDDGAAEPIPVVAAAPAALIETGRPIAPQLLARVRQSHTRLIELETEISWLSLDALLDVKSPAADQRRRLVRELHEAKAEHDRLVDGYRVSLDRDEQSAAAIEIAELERQLAEYEGYAAARVAAMQDFNVATRAVEQAIARLGAAANLLQNDLPRGTRLPKGYRVDTTLATTEDIIAENAFLLAQVRAQIARIISFKRHGRDTAGEAA